MMKALKAKWILPITKEPFNNGVVVVNGGNIEAVLTESDFEAEYPQLKARNFGDAVIMPGFINAHTHLETSIFKGLIDDQSNVSFILDVEKNYRRLNPEDTRTSNYMGLITAIGAGITTLGTMVLHDEAIQQINDSGIRASVFLEVKDMAEKDTKKTISGIENRFAKSKEAAGSLVQLGLAPSSCYSVGPKLFSAISDFSIREKIKLCVHLAESKPEYQFVKYGSTRLANDYRELMNWKDYLWQPMGVSPTRYLNDWGVLETDLVAIHVAEVDNHDLDILEQHNVPVVSCSKHTAKFGGSFTPIGRLMDRKINFGIGTESLASSNNMDMFEEMRICLLLTRRQERLVKGFKSKTFVEAATIGGARVLGIEDQVGSLENGKLADIIVVDMRRSHQLAARDPYSALLYNANETDVIFNMVNGHVLFDNGNFKTLDQGIISEDSNKLVSRLVNG